MVQRKYPVKQAFAQHAEALTRLVTTPISGPRPTQALQEPLWFPGNQRTYTHATVDAHGAGAVPYTLMDEELIRVEPFLSVHLAEGPATTAGIRVFLEFMHFGLPGEEWQNGTPDIRAFLVPRYFSIERQTLIPPDEPFFYGRDFFAVGTEQDHGALARFTAKTLGAAAALADQQP